MMTMEELHKIIRDTDPIDGYQVHLKYLFEHNDAKGIFRITGLDLSEMFRERECTSGIQLPRPKYYTHYTCPPE